MKADLIIGILFVVAGIFGCLPIDGRIAWACVFVAGLLMVLL